MSERSFQEWFRRFREGDQSLEDKPHGYRFIVLDNVVLLEIVEPDSTQTLSELAEYFECDPSTISRHFLHFQREKDSILGSHAQFLLQGPNISSPDRHTSMSLPRS